MSVRDRFLDALHVSQIPTTPPGSPPIVFRAAPNYLKLKRIQWGIGQLASIIGLAGAIGFIAYLSRTDVERPVIWLLRAGEIFGIVTVTFRFIFGWMLVQLDYELRWYMLSDRAIRIREGIITIREKTMALANIQNISIKQGPLQRYLGIADVEVKTAGGGDTSDSHQKGNIAEPMHVAYFRGVDNPEEIRDLIREGVKRQRDAGLGDPDEPPENDDLPSAVAELLAAARSLRETTGGLRKTSRVRTVPPPA